MNERGDEDAAGEEHPRGTLFIGLVFGLIMALAWAAMYFGIFVPRGAVGS